MAEHLDVVDRLNRRMLEIVATALPLLSSLRRDADLAGLAHLREEMIGVLALYRRHAALAHAAALLSGDDAAVAEAQRLQQQCDALGRAYDEFRARWVQRHAEEHWAEYRLSAIRMMKRMRSHVGETRPLRPASPLQAAA